MKAMYNFFICLYVADDDWKTSFYAPCANEDVVNDDVPAFVQYQMEIDAALESNKSKKKVEEILKRRPTVDEVAEAATTRCVSTIYFENVYECHQRRHWGLQRH